MFGAGSCYPSSGGLPLLPVKSICLAMNPVTFGSEGCGPSQNPGVCLSQPQGGSVSSTAAPLSASICFLTGNSRVSQISSLALPCRACCPESSWPGMPRAGICLQLLRSRCSPGRSCLFSRGQRQAAEMSIPSPASVERAGPCHVPDLNPATVSGMKESGWSPWEAAATWIENDHLGAIACSPGLLICTPSMLAYLCTLLAPWGPSGATVSCVRPAWRMVQGWLQSFQGLQGAIRLL